MKKLLTRNLGLKLASLVLGLCIVVSGGTDL